MIVPNFPGRRSLDWRKTEEEWFTAVFGKRDLVHGYLNDIANTFVKDRVKTLHSMGRRIGRNRNAYIRGLD